MSNSPRLILGMGSGRCGTLSLARLLDRQVNARVTHERRPLLPWESAEREELVAERIERLREPQTAIVGDVSSFYLPYVEQFIAREPEIRIVCLRRDCEEVVSSFSRWSDHAHSLPADHWSQQPAAGLFHDPVWSTIFPKYAVDSREQAIRQYWHEYYKRAAELETKYPENFRLFEMGECLNSEEGQRRLLSFVGIPQHEQILDVGIHVHESRPLEPSGETAIGPGRRGISGKATSNCVILVPYSGQIVPGCEDSLRKLEERGYTVRRVRGFSQIDLARSEMASRAMLDGFLETIWIDADIVFRPEAVEKLRAHNLPVVCGIYAKKDRRELACSPMPGTEKLVFGQKGGLHEIRYAAGGFLLVRRQVYLDIQFRLGMPLCNENFGGAMVPYFMPMVRRHRGGQWYLGEDYAFCERARQAGYKIMADTTIRLWHVGNYQYGWEDAGREVERFGDYTFFFND